jgi:hypothetical protein
MPVPTCAGDCDVTLAPVKFNDCQPVVAFSEIRRIFIAKKGAAPFNNWKAAGEWIARISETNITGDDYIRALTVIADKPAAASVFKEISNGRRVVIGKDHTINFTIDDVSDENYEFMRTLECGGEYRFWYETEGGRMFGGDDGFLARVDANSVLNRGRDEIEIINGVMTWRTKFSPERAISPIYNGSSGVTPTTFDTTLTVATATTDTDQGVTATVSATNADQKFEFNAISPRVGTPASMSIKVGGVEEMTVDFTTDYLGTYFKYTDKTGFVHSGGQFTNGEVNF